MTTVTSLTADRMLAIEASSVVSGTVDANGNLILTTKGGTQINAGPVKGPPGPQGPVGSDLQVLSAATILDVGIANQIRAGRQLSPADFANIGLNPPLGLWNLSDLTDASGYGRNLINKGAVSFAAGINGGANTAAQFTGSTAQALYISDIGAADPFRIKTGSWGAWHKTAKRGTEQIIIGKFTSSQRCYVLEVLVANTANAIISLDGTAAIVVTGISDVCDDRWHFLVATCDGTAFRLYVDGILEAQTLINGSIFSGSSVLNLGAFGADASAAAVAPAFGRIDEAFVTADLLTDDQVRNLYCAKIPHTLAAVPSRLSLNVRRRRKGAALVASDFPTQPLRLHNFSGGSLADEGSNNAALINNGAAVPVAGADGTAGNAFNFVGASSQNLSATDANLPVGLATCSYGCWFKTVSPGTNACIIGWGNQAVAARILWIGASGGITARLATDDMPASSYICDGQWHFVVLVEDNAALDGVKRKLYLDGRLNTSSVNFPSTVVAGGANYFRIATWPVPGNYFTGQIDGAFVCDYALTSAQIAALYAKGSQALTPSPKNVGDHIEAMDAANLLATFDTLDSQHQIDLKVAA